MYLGGAELAWISDYAQLYFVDAENSAIAGIEDVSAEAMARGYVLFPNALVIYTADCLRQSIRILIHDSTPDPAATEIISGDGWSKRLETAADFASGAFVVSSPSKTGIEDYLPRFKVPAAKMSVRISWLEIDQDRYNVFRPKPDVIQVELWPRVT